MQELEKYCLDTRVAILTDGWEIYQNVPSSLSDASGFLIIMLCVLVYLIITRQNIMEYLAVHIVLS